MIAEKLLQLPAWVQFEGIEFELRVFSEGQKELRLCYAFYNIDENSRHALDIKDTGSWGNPFIKEGEPYYCDFLYLIEGIETDRDFSKAIDQAKQFLQSNKLLQ